jgi:hypothetical protein
VGTDVSVPEDIDVWVSECMNWVDSRRLRDDVSREVSWGDGGGRAMRDWTSIAGAGAFDHGRLAVERRKTTEAALEQAHDRLRGVTADSLGSVANAGCVGRWAERVEDLRLIEAALQRFRELGMEAPCCISLLSCRCQHQEGVRSCLRGDPHGGRGSQGLRSSTVARGRGYSFLAACLITFWQRSQHPADERGNEIWGCEPAWAATTETLVKLIVTVRIIIFEISRIMHPIRGGVLGPMPVEPCLLLCGAYAA